MDLEVWLAKIKTARSHREVYAILDDFRKLEWADDQCSKMSRLYMRILDNIGPDSEVAATEDDSSAVGAAAQAVAAGSKPAEGAAAPVNDGPVWYEKM